MESPAPSVVDYCGTSDKLNCIYCFTNGNRAKGMWSDSLNVQDLQDLIDRGWRRDGKYFHKPTMDQTCCPQYKIRLEALNFKLSRSHKKVLKQVNRFLIHGVSTRDSVKEPDGEVVGARPTENKNRSELTPDTVLKPAPRPGLGADPCKPVMGKAKDIRLEKKKSRELKTLQISSETEGSVTKRPTRCLGKEKTLTDFLREPDEAENCAHKMEVRIIPSLQDEEFQKNEKESVELFKQYRREIHRNPLHLCTREYWLKALVHSPLKSESKDDGLSLEYGSFHQHYILDGKLIAVGVVDILPRGLSALYLYYHPDYRFLSLGTYAALREIAFVQELNKKAPDFMYYYLGYYVHSCSKMKYKLMFSPSFLLCPETYTWIPIADCLPKFDVNKYSKLAAEDVVDGDEEKTIDSIPVVFSGEIMTYGIYKSLYAKKADDEEVMEYASLVGRRCAQRMLLIRKS